MRYFIIYERGSLGYSEPHYYVHVSSERYIEDGYCADCKALATAPWHLKDRRGCVIRPVMKGSSPMVDRETRSS